MADKADLTFEIWISFAKEVVNTIRLGENDVTNVLSVCTLVEENVQRCANVRIELKHPKRILMLLSYLSL
jgi:head-tail adaptor